MSNSQTESAALHVEHLNKSYGNIRALCNVALTIAPSEIVALLGPNGAGKTTFVSIVAGLRRPDSGSVRVFGIDAIKMSRQARSVIAIAPQETGVYPVLSVRNNLRFFAELAGLRKRALRDAIDSVAETFGLAHLMDRIAATLSGGEKRRLHSALALVADRPLLLLDEPTVGADVEARTRLLRYVQDLAGRGTAVCYSTHYLPEIETLNARVVILDHGRVRASGSIEELISKHAERAVELTFEGPIPEGLFNESLLNPDLSSLRIEQLDRTVRITCDDPAAAAALVMARVSGSDVSPRSISIVQPSLEAVFLSVTGTRLTDFNEDRSDELA